MTARRDRIDLRRTYLPLNPEEYPANLPMNLEQEHEQRTPVFPYEGFNILPRFSGYSSFFGTNKTVGTDPLGPRCDHSFVYKSPEGDNIIFALCEDGVFAQFGDGSTPPIPLAGNALESGDYGVVV
jgi:hypothetical protein